MTMFQDATDARAPRRAGRLPAGARARGRGPHRVLMTADAIGGVWTYALDLAAGLRECGVEVHLATMGGPLDAEPRQAAVRLGIPLHEGDYRLEWMEDAWDSVESAGRWLLDLEQTVRPDLVHLNGFVHAALNWRAPVLVMGHSCVVSWWHAVHGAAPPPAWERYAREVGRGLRAARRVVAPTRAMLAALERHYGPLPPADVVPNGRDLAPFAPARKRRRVLTAGRLWDEAKNVAALDRIAPELPWPVYVAGPTEHPQGGGPRLEHSVAMGPLAPRELRRAMAGAEIFALPARYEPFGYTALEAGLTGCALVLGDIPSLREVWEDAACFVPPADDGALLEMLRWLIAQPRVRHEYARRAVVRARTFTIPRMARATLQAYRAAIAAPGPAPFHPAAATLAACE